MLTFGGHGQVLIPHRHDIKIESVVVSQGFLAAFERRDGLQVCARSGSRESSVNAGARQRFELLQFFRRLLQCTFCQKAFRRNYPTAPRSILRKKHTNWSQVCSAHVRCSRVARCQICPGRSAVCGIVNNAGSQGDFASPVLRMTYSSLTTPTTTIDYHMATHARCVPANSSVDVGESRLTIERLACVFVDRFVKKVQPVLGGFKREDYETRRVWATAADGVRVPISLVYRKELHKQDGSSPLLLNGYGRCRLCVCALSEQCVPSANATTESDCCICTFSYEIPNDPYFASSRLALLDRGFTFAIAHVRGGGASSATAAPCLGALQDSSCAALRYCKAHRWCDCDALQGKWEGAGTKTASF